MDLKQRKSALEAEIRALAMKAQTEQGGHFTPEQSTTVNAKLNELESVKARIKEADESAELMGSITDVTRGYWEEGLSGKDGGGVLTFKNLAANLKAAKIDAGQSYSVKSLQTESIPVSVVASPVPLGRRATSLLDVLPTHKVEHGDQYTYLRQTSRTNNATPVGPGGLKPTSAYGLERVTGKLEVIAHLSEPIFEYYLQDEGSLNQFVSDEMGYGLQTAVESQVLLGDGQARVDGTLGTNLLGLLNQSGIQTQAYVTSKIRTVRSAITKVEVLGYDAGAIVLNPTDWEEIETSTTSTGEYLLEADGTPIDRKARRLWGVPVVLSVAVAAGTGVLLTTTAAVLEHDGNVRMDWGRMNDDFGRNQIRARVEGRFGLQVVRPDGIVEMTLTGA